VNDELDFFCLGDTDFEHASIDSSADEHDEVVEIEHSDRVAVGVEHVIVCSPCLRVLSEITGSTSINSPDGRSLGITVA